MNAVFEASALPLYVQVADLLRSRLSKGVWPEGSLLPTLDELGESLGVSTITLRQAIEILSKEGLVSSKRGRGTIVTGSVPEQRWLKVQTRMEEFAQHQDNVTFDVQTLSETLAMPELHETDGLAAPQYVCMKRLHARVGEPYSVLTIYLDKRIFDLSPERFRKETVVPHLVKMPEVNIAKAKQTLTIDTADVEVASQLGIAVNAPIALIRRVFCSPSGQVIYMAEITQRGTAIKVEMDLLTN
jgi:GntR family transcriptional regulator